MASRKAVAEAFAEYCEVLINRVATSEDIKLVRAKTCSTISGQYISYATCIAEWNKIKEVVVITPLRYSVTTQRHKNELIGALESKKIPYIFGEVRL